jgi:hypothetical protein
MIASAACPSVTTVDRDVPARRVEMSGKALDDLDEFVAAEAVVAGEFDEIPCPGEHRPALGGARDGDAPSAPEFQQSFLPKDVQGPQDGVPVHAQHGGEVFGQGQAFAGARLAVPETIQSAQLAGMTVSPDGTRLALDLRRSIQSIQVVTLATGAIRSWAWQGGGWIGNRKPFGQIFSWTAGGTTLEFQQWASGSNNTMYIRLLDTTTPGTSLASSKTVLTFPNGGAFGMNTLLTPDGTKIITATPQGITEFSARTGQPILSEDQFQFDWQKLGWATGPPWQEALWAGPGGQALIVWDPRAKPGRYGPGNVLGVLTGNTFTPIPNGTYDGTFLQIAW